MDAYPYLRTVPALPHKRYGIEPQRDSFKGTPDGADGSTWFVRCEDHEAELWAIFEHDDDFPGDWELVGDWDTLADAERWIAGLHD